MNERERFEKASALFLEASRLQPGEVSAFLDQRCGNDEALKSQVRALLGAAGEESVFGGLAEELGSIQRRLRSDLAESPTLSLGAPRTDDGGHVEKVGDMIGRYRLLEMIGEGGFGRVWVAEQRDAVQRRVALKVIKAGMDTRQVVARFEQERQALAVMDHPGIAKVFDAGATDRGRPYFVMELCKGEPIAAFCDQHNLNIRQRLELAEQVCAAVQHAHTKGIIHRDLKPSNVLVAMQDGRPMAKVIDFGIAKATNARLIEKTLYTEHRQLVGTPEYMSPEQAGGSLDIDTRTDVYSLGVMLYELLTGSTPFSSQELRSAAFGEIERIIREVDPPKPSTRLSQSGGALLGVAASRQVEPARLGSLVRGELDWIVMKALEKDRARRYESPSSLSADIRRYLAGEAVQAAPPDVWYRMRKVLRRNRGVFASIGAVVAALLVGVGAFAWQATIARGQRDRAVAAEAQARQRANELQRVSDFQSQMLSQVDVAAAGVRLTTDVRSRLEDALSKAGASPEERAAVVAGLNSAWARINSTDVAQELIKSTILQPGLTAIDRQFADQPRVEASLRAAIGDRYMELGMFDDAWTVSERLLQGLRKSVGEDHPHTIAAIIAQSRILTLKGRATEADAMLRPLLAKWRKILKADDPLVLSAGNQLGESLIVQGKPDEAEKLLREALDGRRRSLGDDNPETMATIANLALAIRSGGRFKDAEPLEREALERRRRVLGEGHAYTLASYDSLAGLLAEQGKAAEAEALFREAYAARRRVLGEVHPSTLQSAVSLATVLGRNGAVDEAATMLRELHSTACKVLGEDHPDSLNALSNLATYLIEREKFAEAEPMCRSVLERRTRILGPKHPNTLVSLNVMGFLMQRQQRAEDALVYLRRALEVSRDVWGEDHPERLVLLINTGSLLNSLDRASEAEQLLAEAHERSERTLGLDHPYTQAAMLNRVDVLRRLKKDDQVIAVLRRVEPPVRKAAPGGNDSRVRTLLRKLGGALARSGRFAEAEPCFEEAHRLAETAKGKNDEETLRSTQSMAEMYESWEASDPGRGHAVKAAQWRAQLAERSPAAPATKP